MKQRILSAVMALVLCLSLYPAWALAEESAPGSCPHHRSHTPECGYQEAEPGQKCTHKHTEDCYRTAENCIHEHGASCYPEDKASEDNGLSSDAEEKQPTECSHLCSEDSGCVTKELDCRHEHDGDCGYLEEIPGSPCTFVCGICSGEIPEDDIKDNDSETPVTENGDKIEDPVSRQEETEKCVCEELCKEGAVNMDCPVCGAEDAGLSDCKGKAAEENTERPEDAGICRHHQEHDETCGYRPASEDGEGSPCTYDCRICPIEDLIAALPDAENITEDNADEVRAQLDEILALFAELTEDEQEQVDLPLCYELQAILDSAKTPVPADEIPEGAVVKVEKDGGAAAYAGADDLDALFARNSGNSGVTVTLLADVERTSTLFIYISCTLNLNGHTIRNTGSGACVLVYDASIIVTIQGEGGSRIISEQSHALGTIGNVTLKGGTFIGNGENYAGVYVISENVTLSVTGENVVIQNTGGGYGLAVNMAQSVQLSAGEYSGTAGAIIVTDNSDLRLGDLLAHTDTTRYAYFDGAGTAPITGRLSEKALAGTVTVGACDHAGEGICEYIPIDNTETHSKTCLACGRTEAEACVRGEYQHNETDHWQICKLCGGKKTGAHTSKCLAALSGNVITVSDGCETCGYAEDLGIITLAVPENLTYSATAGQKVTLTGDWLKPGELTIILDNGQENEYNGPYLLPDLAIGEHNLTITVNPAGVSGGARCKVSFTVRPAALTGDMVTLSAGTVYDGAEHKPAVTVRHGGKTLTEGTDYEITYDSGNFTNAGTVQITVAGKGNYTGEATKGYTIYKADVPADKLSYTAPDDLIYTGQAKTAVVTADGLTGIGTITVKYRKDNSGELMAEAKEPGAYRVYAVISEGQNYKAAEINAGRFTVSYMPSPAILYNGGEKKDWYKENVSVSAGAGYTVSDSVYGQYKESFTIRAEEGMGRACFLRFKDAAGHISDSVAVNVRFDLTAPAGKIAAGAKWWQKNLHFMSFGHYAAKEYTVTVKAEDTDGSGIGKIEYAVVTGADQYTDAGALAAAGLNWTEYDDSGKPTVSANAGQYVVYARLTDKAGNVAYISTEGILLDSTPPAVGSLSVPEDTRKDVTAGFTFTVSEAADYYYAVLPKDSAAPSSAEDIIVTCGGTLPEGKTGNAVAGTVSCGMGAVSEGMPAGSVSAEAENLKSNTAYTVYVTVVDKALDITSSEAGKPAGNIGNVAQADFTTKKTRPVVTKAPAVSGTYGQSIGEMTVTDGTAENGRTAVTGTWAVSSTDKDKKPSAGTADKVTVIFTPDTDSYDSVSVKITPTVGRRSLNASGVTVSEVAGAYIYDNGAEIKPPLTVSAGTPSTGISISDSGAVLTGNDFTVSYSNNKNAGINTASVTITGKGNYTGSVTKYFTIEKAPGREVPDLTGSHTDDGKTYTYTVTPAEGAVYRMGGGVWTDGNVFKDITPGTRVIFYAKMPEDKNYEEGQEKSLTVDFPKLTPPAPALTYKADRTNKADVKVTITPVNGAEYSFDGGQTWTDSNEKGGFTTSQTVVLAIRLKETATHNPSPAQTVTADLAKKDREAPPAFTLLVTANKETDYTVAIPPEEGCEYGFDGVTWSDVNVKTGVKAGETVTGYKRYKENNDYNASSAVSAKETMPKFRVKTPVISPAGGSYSGSVSVTITCASPDAEIYYTTDGSTPRRSSALYTGAFSVTAPATVKAIAIKDGFTDSAEASETYTKKSGGGSGGNGGGGNSGGGNDGSDPGGGSTVLQVPAIPPADAGTDPGNKAAQGGPEPGITPVNPGSKTDASAQETKQPFIKGADGKIGWDVIRAEEAKAEEGSAINVDMNGSTVVPGDIFDSARGRDITVTFDMGDGILWSVDGKSITTDKAGDIDFSVQTGTDMIPVDIINNVAGEGRSIQISLAYEGEFGFTAVLFINLGKENGGLTASLYYYNESTGELAFICKDGVAEDGTAELAFTHASDYAIVIDGEAEENGGAAEPAQPEAQDENNTRAAEENPQTGQAWRPWRIAAAGVLIIFLGIGVFWAIRRKKETENN